MTKDTIRLYAPYVKNIFFYQYIYPHHYSRRTNFIIKIKKYCKSRILVEDLILLILLEVLINKIKF